MGGSMMWRLAGLVLLGLAAAMAWFFILGPLEQAQAQAPGVRYSTKAFVFVGFAAVFGAFFLLMGNSVAYRHAEKQSPTAAGWVLLVLSAAVSGAGFWWAERQFEALGYAYSGANPSHPPVVTPFVFPAPPPVARPTFSAPAER
jgi:hypothetical protein